MAKIIWLAVVLVSALAAQSCLADKIDFKYPVRSAADDEVKDLPGLSEKINFKHYSGYLEADDKKNRFWHYWFVESQSSPDKDPLVLWLNGGPGCSSLLGLMTELGPFKVGPNNTVMTNPFAWNKRANVIFMESPAGVGFTYAADGDVTANDDTTAQQNHMALKSFFRKFPEFAGRPLYLTGESYGGVYLPTLAVLVNKDSTMNLKGVAIGNGYLDANKLANALVYFSYYHGLIGSSTWSGLSKHCCNGQPPARQNCKFTDPNRSSACSAFVTEATDSILESGVNPYNLYDQCYGAGSVKPVIGREHFDKSLMMHALGVNPKFKSKSKFHGRRGFALQSRNFSLIGLGEDPPCTDDSVTIDYLNQAHVKTALHIPEGLAPFTTCSNIAYTMIYPNQEDGLAPQMRELIDSPRKPTLLVYNGDVDMMCNFFGDEWFVDDLNRKVIKDYGPWPRSGQVAGWVKYYDRITFMTIKGSGHMVPTDKPAEALDMFERFLDGMKPE